ncbi:MAG: DUF3754 domain-containing protein [Paracoccaceae bacterium]
MSATGLDHYIPIAKHELIAAIVGECPTEGGKCRRLLHWLGLLYHVQFFEQQEQLKTSYEAFDPDSRYGTMVQPDPAAYRRLRAELEETLDAANFKRLSRVELRSVNPSTGRLGQKVKLPKGVFRDIRFYARGARMRMITTPGLLGLPLFRRKIEVLGYDHVLLAVTASYGLKDKLVASARLRPGAVYLKLFRDIAQGDLMTLIPHARISLLWRDRMFLSVPALIAGVPLLLKVVPAAAVMLLATGAYFGVSGQVEEDTSKKAIAAAVVLGGLIGFLIRVWTSYDRRALRNQKQVIDNAYFNKLNTNAGCFDYLIGTAEDAELKEVFLAYIMLQRSDVPLSLQELDAQVEDWIAAHFDTSVDFEIDDALQKLRKLDLVSGPDDALVAVPLSEALASAARAWHGQADRLGIGPLI